MKNIYLHVENFHRTSLIAVEIRELIVIICSQRKKLAFIKIPTKISLRINLNGFCASTIAKLDSKCLTAKYKIKPIRSAFAIINSPELEELPKIFSRYVEVSISESIKAISSKAEYIELSIDENIELKSSFIVDKIVFELRFKISTS
ncbi:MAG: hypothetical protein HFJ50_01145 [Clostridia bacterium]|nr:hypothetical protein [Clostridia bacterium]